MYTPELCAKIRHEVGVLKKKLLASYLLRINLWAKSNLVHSVIDYVSLRVIFHKFVPRSLETPETTVKIQLLSLRQNPRYSFTLKE